MRLLESMVGGEETGVRIEAVDKRGTGREPLKPSNLLDYLPEPQ